MKPFDTKYVIKHLEKKWGNAECPMCKKIEWSIPESLYQLNRCSDEGYIIPTSPLPVVAVTCNNCGNTILICAIKMGLVKEEKPT